MAANHTTRTPRPKSIAAKPKALTLRPHEARRLAEAGEVLIVREVGLRMFGPSDTPGYDWTFRRDRDGCWEDYRTADFLAKFSPFGPIGSMLAGREEWALDDPARLKLAEHEGGCNPDWIYRREPIHEGTGIRWRSANTMPLWASRFPHLRHESCCVKRVRDLVDRELEQTGMHPSSEDAVRMANRTPELWLWCSLVRKVDGAEVADV